MERENQCLAIIQPQHSLVITIQSLIIHGTSSELFWLAPVDLLYAEEIKR